VPAVAAVSCRADGSGFAFGLAARPRLEAAVRSAITEMCQLELADSVVAAKRSERGDDALNAQDRTHLRRAMINADQCPLLQPVAEHATHLSIRATEGREIFSLIAERLEKLGIETFCLDLTRRFFGVPVVRVIAPGLQLEAQRNFRLHFQQFIRQLRFQVSRQLVVDECAAQISKPVGPFIDFNSMLCINPHQVAGEHAW